MHDEDGRSPKIVSFVEALAFLAAEAEKSGSRVLADSIGDALTTALKEARDEMKMAS